MLSARADTPGQTSTAVRPMWLVLIVGGGALLSAYFACATPFAALATLAALKLGRRDMFGAMGLVWLANQAVGYGVLGYPWTWDSGAGGVAIGLSATLSSLAASALSTQRPAPLAVSLPFVAAFVAFEFGLYCAGSLLPESPDAFAPAVVWHIFLINAASLAALVFIHSLGMLVWHWSRQTVASTATASVI